MLDVVIPLAGKSAWTDNNELRYFLRSLDKNLKIPFRVKLFARQLPGWISKEVDYEIVPKFYPDSARKHHEVKKYKKKHYENYFDVLHKLDVISRDDSLGENVLYGYDDMLLLQPVTNQSILEQRIAMMHYREGKKIYDANTTKWGRTATRAFGILKDLKRPLWDYETHLPRMLNRKMLRVMFAAFPVEQEVIPYAPSTLYHNLFYDKPDDKIYKQNKIKAGFYGSRSKELIDYADYPCADINDIKKYVKGKLWLNYNNNGIAKYTELKGWIQKSFPKKSRFER